MGWQTLQPQHSCPQQPRQKNKKSHPPQFNTVQRFYTTAHRHLLRNSSATPKRHPMAQTSVKTSGNHKKHPERHTRHQTYTQPTENKQDTTPQNFIVPTYNGRGMSVLSICFSRMVKKVSGDFWQETIKRRRVAPQSGQPAFDM